MTRKHQIQLFQSTKIYLSHARSLSLAYHHHHYNHHNHNNNKHKQQIQSFRTRKIFSHNTSTTPRLFPTTTTTTTLQARHQQELTSHSRSHVCTITRTGRIE
ncbi:hypothetical protein E2C01_062887 [Portunus trituberculatus]|uniref:Uncharacterized protein n=1 Tax=Portunus trituberculatus TaxID=210409 RepID=A0A5B7HEZ2_PORTR|nr:hypothetical protein [Portunus trituberculatus]